MIVKQLSDGQFPRVVSDATQAMTNQNLGLAQVRPVERLSPRTATVDWFESGICHYAEQTWIKGVSQRNGSCALTKRPIQPGDSVYRPRSTAPAPINARAMIVAEEISIMPEAWLIA
jgi:hypothetical protein